MIPLYVDGLGFWSPGYPDPAAWNSRQPAPAVAIPAAPLIPANLRRRTTLPTRMAAEAIRQAGQSTDLSRTPMVFGSAYGELSIMDRILRAICQQGMPSPTDFHNSVHNTACGTISIATANRGFSTVVAAGSHTPALTLVEAGAWLGDRGGAAMVVMVDESPLSPLDRFGDCSGFALALLLDARQSPSSRACLSDLRIGRVDDVGLPTEFRRNPCAGGIALLDALLSGSSKDVALSSSCDNGWLIRVDPTDRT